MEGCRHPHILIVKDVSQRLRCRHCHLTLKPDELVHGYCPECYEADGKKHDDFEEIPASSQDNNPIYRCEQCGVELKPSNLRSR